ncbi:uncharacterized protein LOC122303063 isoform X2 [Carya illinoinensis]|uniref:uncharacterized protein LOC122303063 isoform X2 n=1 Tax=Carya illinoinensis TaxID=32201 RepID=UPI001C7240EF|nr:uncharacterized protein LOC122303063 isoform X2 [Carya illinoinensis]
MMKDPIKHDEPDPVMETNRKRSLHGSYKVFRNCNSSAMAKSEVQDTVSEENSSIGTPFAGIEQTGMETIQNSLEPKLSNKKKKKKRKTQKPSEEGCLTSTNDMSIMSALSLSDGRNSGGKVVSLGTDETSSFFVTNSSHLLHNNNLSNGNSYLMTTSEVQDTILGVGSKSCPSLARTEQTGMETSINLMQVDVARRKKRNRKSRKKAKALQNNGQGPKHPDQGCMTSINHTDVASALSLSDGNLHLMTTSEVQDTVLGVGSTPCPSLARTEQTGMETSQNVMQVDEAHQKKSRKSRKKKAKALQNNRQGPKHPYQGCMTSTNHTDVVSGLSLSDGRNSGGKVVSLGTDETSSFFVTNSSRHLLHNNSNNFSSGNSYLMTTSEVQDTILGVGSTLCPSLARTEQTGKETSQNLMQVDVARQKKRNRKIRKKKAKALQNNGQGPKHPDQGCMTSTNHTDVMSDGRNCGGKVVSLGTDETSSFFVTHSSRHVLHNNSNNLSNGNSYLMTKSEVQDTVLGVGSTLCPSLARTEQTGMETSQNLMQVDVARRKKRNRKIWKKKAKALQNNGQGPKHPDQGCMTCTYHTDVVSAPSLSDGRNSGGKVVSLGTDETNSLWATKYSQSLSHGNYKVFSNGTSSSSVAQSEVQGTFLGVDIMLCPSLARVEQTGMEIAQNSMEVNVSSKKKSRSLKKKPKALQISGQVEKLPEEGCVTKIINAMSTQSHQTNIMSATCPLDARIEKSISLGPDATNSFPSLSHENRKVFGNANSFSMSKSEEKDIILGVDSTVSPSFSRIEEVGKETTQNSLHVNPASKKKKKRRSRKKSEALQNSSEARTLPEESCPSIRNQMNIISTLMPSDERNNCSEIFHIPLLRAPVGHLRKKLLILDINGLLADIVRPPPKKCKSDINIAGRAIFKRPFYLDFLTFCFERFEVGVWSSRSKKNVEKVIDYLMGDMKYKLLLCWDQSHCTATKFRTLEDRHKPMVFKELRRIWEKHDPNLPWEKGDYNESNTLLLDDSPYKALLNPLHTAIFPYSYTFRKRSDKSLGYGK